jgi:hypothetical protein
MSTSANQRRLRLIRSPPPGDERPLEFAVRFSPSMGLRAWLKRPTNSYGWLGRGTVHVEHGGLRISARRLTPWGLQRVTRLIRHSEVRDVYREGNAIQLNLRGGARRAFVRLWAEDAARAARLVALFPTHRTLELEALPTPPEPRRPPSASTWLLLVILAALLAFAWLGTAHLRRASRNPPRAVPAPVSRIVPRVAPSPLADAELTQMRVELEKFDSRAAALSMQFNSAWDALLVGDMSQRQFIGGLEQWLLPQWNSMARDLPPADATTARGRMLQYLHACASGWTHALTLYAYGLRDHNPREVTDALSAIGDARMQEHAAWFEVQELERTGAAQTRDSGR